MSENHSKFCDELKKTIPTTEESNFAAVVAEREESKAQYASAKAQYEEAKRKLKEAEEFDKMAREFIQKPADPSLNHDEVAYGKIKTAEIAGDKLSRAQVDFDNAKKALDEAEKRIQVSKEFARE